jgi:hypothetical protein
MKNIFNNASNPNETIQDVRTCKRTHYHRFLTQRLRLLSPKFAAYKTIGGIV